jgi:hypothetical protein
MTNIQTEAKYMSSQKPTQIIEDASIQHRIGCKRQARLAVLDVIALHPDNVDVLKMASNYFGGLGNDPYMARALKEKALQLEMDRWASLRGNGNRSSGTLTGAA